MAKTGKVPASVTRTVTSNTRVTSPILNANPPDDDNTPSKSGVLNVLQGMSDDQLVNLWQRSKSISMPNMLNDVQDDTQSFVFAAGLNERPTVLEDADYTKFLKDNGISDDMQLSRTVSDVSYRNASNTQVNLSAQQITDMMKYSRLNYIGGKHGGQVYGAGTYFDQNGGANTGYGSSRGSQTSIAVLNPKTAKVIDYNTLASKAQVWRKSHPKFSAAVGSFGYNGNESVYALAMGYNVIKAYSYHNVIDRSALVYRKSNL